MLGNENVQFKVLNLDLTLLCYTFVLIFIASQLSSNPNRAQTPYCLQGSPQLLVNVAELC